MSFTKPRNTRANSAAFGRRVRERGARNRSRGGGGPVAGQFEYLKLTEIAVWLRLQQQSYSYDTYDRTLKEVVRVEDSPFLEYSTHYFPRRKRSLNCSSGAHKKQPCFSCAIVSAYWDTFREKEDEMRQHGIQGKLEKNPPLSSSVRNALALTGVDDYYEVPILDKEGKPRRNGRGDLLKKFVAAPVAKFPKGTKLPSKEGHNMYWQFAGTHLEQLQTFNEQLADYCGNCATPMHTTKIVCADCGALEQDFGAIIEGEDLLELRSEIIQCSSCHGEDVLPIMECSGCENPEQGGLFDFDLRLKAVPIGDKKTDLHLVGVRMPDYSPDLMKLYETPLDVAAICAPMSISIQKSVLGDLVEGVDPLGGAPAAESYVPKTETKTEDFGDDDIPY